MNLWKRATTEYFGTFWLVFWGLGKCCDQCGLSVGWNRFPWRGTLSKATGQTMPVGTQMLATNNWWRGLTKTSSVLILSVLSAIAQTQASRKPCIAFVPESDSPTNTFAEDPLQAAVMLSGDFVFYPSRHEDCWNVHVISLPVKSAKGKSIGYAVSHTITDPHNVEVGHALTFGPDRDIFLQAMRRATADAIRNIRLSLPAQKAPDESDTALDARR